jgi:hypothetical protein
VLPKLVYTLGLPENFQKMLPRAFDMLGLGFGLEWGSFFKRSSGNSNE